MTDLEMTRLCAEALGYDATNYTGQIYAIDKDGSRRFDPLRDDAQAMALVKKLKPIIDRDLFPDGSAEWAVTSSDKDGKCIQGINDDLNRAIVECVSRMQAAK